MGNLGYLGNIFQSFLMPELSILSYSQNQKLGFKKRGKNVSRFPRFLRFPSFQPGQSKQPVSLKSRFR